jgi:hypothetical protein
MKSCFWCGTPVSEADWDEVGRTRVYVCGAAECVRELRAEQRGADEDAREAAERDGYERYR